MRFTRTVYGIIAGVLILTHTPATMGLQLDTFKKVMGYAFFFGTCAAIGITGRWLYEAFMCNPQCKPQFDEMDKQAGACYTNLSNVGIYAKAHAMEVEKQKNHLFPMKTHVHRAQEGINKLSQATQSIAEGLNTMAPIATSILEHQRQTRSELKKADATLQESTAHIGMTARMFSRMTEPNKQYFLERMKSMKRAEDDLSKANADLDQAKTSLEKREQIIWQTQQDITRQFSDIHKLLDSKWNSQEKQQVNKPYRRPQPSKNNSYFRNLAAHTSNFSVFRMPFTSTILVSS